MAGLCSQSVKEQRVGVTRQRGESDDSEACEITAVSHVSDPVASFDLCEEQDQEEKERCTAELLESTQETLEWLRKREPDHEKLLVSLQIT
jgi:hypothetical protein